MVSVRTLVFYPATICTPSECHLSADKLLVTRNRKCRACGISDQLFTEAPFQMLQEVHQTVRRESNGWFGCNETYQKFAGIVGSGAETIRVSDTAAGTVDWRKVPTA